MPSILRRALYEIAQSARGLPCAVFVDITERCDLKCRMCRFWSDGAHDTSRELDVPKLRALLDEARRDLGVRRLRFVGGEPFLHRGLLDVVKHARSLGMFTNVVTNGWLVDADMARRVVASGLDSIRVSVDGIGAVHDRMRGREGSFARAEAAIDHLVRARAEAGVSRPEIQVFTLITALNSDALDEVRAWTRTRGVPVRHFWGPLAETTPEQVRTSVWEDLPLADGFHLPFGPSLAVTPERDRTLRAASRSSRVARFAARLGLRTHCPEAHNLHVDAYGRVKFCALFRNHAYGVYPHDPLREIWFSARHLRFLKHIHRAPMPMCREQCGMAELSFQGNLPQLARQLLLNVVPSPMRGDDGHESRFVHEPAEETLAPPRTR